MVDATPILASETPVGPPDDNEGYSQSPLTDAQWDAIAKLNDNYPIPSATTFAQNSTRSYYFLDEPTELELQKVARFTSYGHRICWKSAKDAWSNKFQIKFPDLSHDEAKVKNKQMTAHLRKIRFYNALKNATGFDREMGESLVMVHREGQSWIKVDGTEKDQVDYFQLQGEANLTKKVLRVEAINKLDYSIQQQGAFGYPTQYRISFYRKRGQRPSFFVHPTHCLRIRTQDIDYDQYRGQSALKPIFHDIQILLNIESAGGDAAVRWGTGCPAIFTRLSNDNDMAKLKDLIGNPTTKTWFIVPQDIVTDIKMLGVSSTMLDLKSLADFYLNLISMQTGIPRPILLGEVAGVVTGSEVNLKEYYAFLDELHSELEPFVREFFELDPECMAILGDDEYEIDWGLRQVMSRTDEAELHTKMYANAVNLMAFGTLNECRKEAGLAPIENVIDHALCEKLYGMPATDLGQVIAQDVGQIFPEVNFTPPVQGGEQAPQGNSEAPTKEDPSPEERGFTAAEERERNNKSARRTLADTASKEDQATRESQHIADSLLAMRDLVSLNKMEEMLPLSKKKIAEAVDWAEQISTP